MIFIFVALIVILILLFVLKDEKPEYRIYIEIAINISVVIISIVGTAIISTPLIEKKNNNKIYFDAILNDVLSDEKVIELMSDDNKKKIKHQLLNVKCNAKQEMVDYIHNAISDAQSEYYFEDCSYIISCNIKDEYIEKRIVKNLKIRSYENAKIIKNFAFVRMCTGSDIPDDNPLQIENVCINNNVLNLNQYECVVENVREDEVALKKSNYDKKYVYKYKKSLKLSNKTTTDISITYTTKVSLHDKYMCLRVSEPCRHFSVDFTVLNKNPYDICIHGFGFMNDATSTPNIMDNSNNAKISFNTWIFKKDGVSIGFSQKA